MPVAVFAYFLFLQSLVLHSAIVSIGEIVQPVLSVREFGLVSAMHSGVTCLGPVR